MARVRLPLEVGVSSLNNLVYGVVMVLDRVRGHRRGARPGSSGPSATDDFIAYPLIFGVGLLVSGVWCLRKAWRERPSDALFDGPELVLDGGAYDGLRLTFVGLDPSKCVVEPQFKQSSEGKREADGFEPPACSGPAGRQHPRRARRQRHRRAIAARPVRGDRRAVLDDATDRPAPRSSNWVRVLLCAGCGMPVAPSDVEALPCPGCNAAVPMSEDIRTRVRAANALTRDQARVDRIAPRLLEQPGARATTRHLAASLALIGLAWPIAAVMVVHLAKHHALTPGKGALIALLPFLLIADGFFLSRLRLVDRRALATVTLGYAAIPPAKPGAAPTCHNCHAPLPATPAVVARCLFCSIENLMNLDVRPSAKRAEQAAVTLDAALRSRAAERRLWRWGTIISAPLFVATVIVVRHLWRGEDPRPRVDRGGRAARSAHSSSRAPRARCSCCRTRARRGRYVDASARFQATYVGAFAGGDGGALVAVAAHAWNGMVMVQAPPGLAAEQIAVRRRTTAVALTGRAVAGLHRARRSDRCRAPRDRVAAAADPRRARVALRARARGPARAARPRARRGRLPRAARRRVADARRLAPRVRDGDDEHAGHAGEPRAGAPRDRPVRQERHHVGRRDSRRARRDDGVQRAPPRHRPGRRRLHAAGAARSRSRARRGRRLAARRACRGRHARDPVHEEPGGGAHTLARRSASSASATSRSCCSSATPVAAKRRHSSVLAYARWIACARSSTRHRAPPRSAAHGLRIGSSTVHRSIHGRSNRRRLSESSSSSSARACAPATAATSARICANRARWRIPFGRGHVFEHAFEQRLAERRARASTSASDTAHPRDRAPVAAPRPRRDRAATC